MPASSANFSSRRQASHSHVFGILESRNCLDWCRLMCDAGIKLNRPGMKKSGQADLLKEFAEACRGVDFVPPLTSRDAKFLLNLQTERIY